jgi:pimeloyl-ACP methyl ester carboxylesterase
MIDTWATHGLPDEIADTIAGIILGTGSRETAYWQHKWRGWQSHNLLAAFHTLTSRDDVTDQLGAIEQPSLVVHGDADMAIPMAGPSSWRSICPTRNGSLYLGAAMPRT